ncbi:FAD-dependent oxidoreductase [Amycolatopsis sp. PS_44_ISF1]|uniref:NAD(P)/FAD-dependent oxidoreductase n=1 Tax=Amycolatopsis sp. PS_44_ISF1 TaxID=2974917 RepID=UPI0028DE145C|nr:FAD-dependent oxidoreductase [Amycolatopsis sp. PS_44_ISF1]MDT8915407.1 FAD-dependent oxidoreductase [Amycolatopsis sp. PS_44_ISF1]
MRVIVIGSGIGGAATAYHLAAAGAEVVSVDAPRPGVATEAGAGIVSPWTSRWDDQLYPLAAAAGAYYPRLAAALAEEGQDSSYEVVGGLVVSDSAAELDEAQARLAARVADAPVAGTVSRLDPAQARALFPALAPELGAVHLSGAGRVDGRRMRRALIAAAKQRGARFARALASLRPNTPADRGPWRVAAGDEELTADAVVLSAGAWSASVAEPLGVEVPVAPQRGQITHFELPGTETAAWPVVLPRTSHYLLAFPGGHVVAGATRETGSGFDHRVTAAGQREVLDHALAVAPGLADSTLAETRIGFRPSTPDALPLLGPVESRPGLWLATGFGPAGLTLAPYAGKLIAELVLGGEVPAGLLEPCSPARFG